MSLKIINASFYWSASNIGKGLHKKDDGKHIAAHLTHLLLRGDGEYLISFIHHISIYSKNQNKIQFDPFYNFRVQYTKN